MARWLLALALVWCARAQVPRPRCAEREPRCRSQDAAGLDEHQYTVDGVKLTLKYKDSSYYVFECAGNLTLDNTALPRFTSTLRVNQVQLIKCPLPSSSYADVCSRLNVLALDKLKLSLEGAGALSAAHLAGLRDVRALELAGGGLRAGALAALPALRRLSLDAVRLPPARLAELPRALRTLQLVRMGVDLTRAALAPLAELVNVTLRDTRDVSVELSPSLRALALDTPAARVPSELTPALRSLTLNGWGEARPARWSSCALAVLDVRYVAAEELPAGWLAECGALRELRVFHGKRLRALHATSLRGARRLQRLTLSRCALSELPAGLLDDAAELSLLDLSENHLLELPGGLFARTTALKTLNLSKNRLTVGVYESLSAVTSLTSLNLSFNELKDSCGGADDTVRGSSPLQELKQLTELSLRQTGSSLMCRDWREAMTRLTSLDLSRNNITSITYWDLVFPGSARLELDLRDNPVRALLYGRADFLRAAAGDVSRAAVRLSAALRCDCHSYWAARALRERPRHVSLQGAACAGGAELARAPLDELLCAAPELCGAAPACSCATREAGSPGPARLLRVRCERGGLTRLSDALAPLLRTMRREGAEPDHYEWQLLLAHNRIAELDAADFPKHLTLLDLTNNSLSSLSAQAARALVAAGRRARLAHNPLQCECGAADALAALQAHGAQLQDYAAVTCADGMLLADARAEPCAALGAAALAALGALLLLLLLVAGAGVALLTRPALLLRVKAALHARGWLPVAPEPDGDERLFDVFLSFSHGDERFVREQLVARLESGPAPYRLCVHYRDWAPGGWIPAQIAASVRASRRTVAVVSEHFLRSAWARAELQEAYALALRDARPRLVVVLLDEPAALPLDDRLRSYLATNTYVRWGDPWFWEKLRLALPRGRGPAPGVRPSAPGPPSADVSVCSERCAAATLSSPLSSESSSASSSSAPGSGTSSALELERLVNASCGAQAMEAGGAQAAGVGGAHAGARAVPV